jgi:hypothetical protein
MVVQLVQIETTGQLDRFHVGRIHNHGKLHYATSGRATRGE